MSRREGKKEKKKNRIDRFVLSFAVLFIEYAKSGRNEHVVCCMASPNLHLFRDVYEQTAKNEETPLTHEKSCSLSFFFIPFDG